MKRWNVFRALGAALLAVCLSCALAVAVHAEPDYAVPVDVTSEEALASVLRTDEPVTPIPVARLADDVTVNGEIFSLGKLIVPEGRTLTVAPQGYLEVELAVESGGAVTVEPDGCLSTTMGGNVTVAGTLAVQEGATLVSCMGGRVVVRQGGVLTLDGEFQCGCYGDEAWFENEGTVNGGGAVLLSSADEEQPADLFAAEAKVMAMLDVAQLPNEEGVGIYVQKPVDTEEALAGFLGQERDVEGNCDLIVLLTGDVTVTGPIEAMSRINVLPGVTLTIEEGAFLRASVVAAPGGTVRVCRGGALSTTMGGDVIVAGQLVVEHGGEVRSDMGASLVVEEPGKLTLDGTFFCEGFRSGEWDIVPWFRNRGTVEGTGDVVIEPIFIWENEEMHLDDGEERMIASSLVEAELNNEDVTVYTTATSFEQMKMMAAVDYVQGIIVQKENEEAAPMIFVTEDLDLRGKKLRVGGVDLVIGAGAELQLALAEDLSFASRWGRVVVEAAGAAEAGAPAGGTLSIAGTKLMSGTDPGAFLRPVRDIVFVSGAEYSDFPSGPVWLYVPDSAAAELAGAMSPALDDALQLIVDGELTVTGSASLRYLELRAVLSVVPGAELDAQEIGYAFGSRPDAVRRGSEVTFFHCVFSRNAGGQWYEDILNFRPEITDGKIYLERNGVPLSPEREGYTFTGWTVTSEWQGTPLWTVEMEQQLAAMQVEQDEQGAFVREPTAFPVVVKAGWQSAGEPGDMNGDGKVNGKDVTLLQRFVAGGYGVSLELSAADLNGDNKVNGKDVTLLQRFVAGGYGVILG